MRKHDMRCYAFPFQSYGVDFEAVFIAEGNPWKLMVGARGTSHKYFEFEVKPGFLASTRMESDDYHKCLEVLNLKYKPGKPFKPRYLLEDLKRSVPRKIKDSNQKAHHVLGRCLVLPEEQDKIYFLGWAKHRWPRRASNENLAKTRMLLGEKAYQSCWEHNISSRWSAVPGEEKEVTVPPTQKIPRDKWLRQARRPNFGYST